MDRFPLVTRRIHSFQLWNAAWDPGLTVWRFPQPCLTLNLNILNKLLVIWAAEWKIYSIIRLNRWGNYSALINSVPSKELYWVVVVLSIYKMNMAFLLCVRYFMVNSHWIIQEKHSSLWNYVIQILLPP